MVLSAYFKKIEIAKKKLLVECLSEDDIIIHVVEQMYKSNWFTEEHMTEWEELDDGTKTWEECKAHFKRCYITRKWYYDAKKTRMEEVNMIKSK